MRYAVAVFAGLYLLAYVFSLAQYNATNPYGGQNVLESSATGGTIVHVYDRTGRWMCSYWDMYARLKPYNAHDCSVVTKEV